ncbi:putative zinc finger protein CONSTANS-LIKE 11 [Gastrolobium bilobum]|uniref:putative zinc finger protein CONSTANS-LIKE 11 n=1 Tax=Gastrolobium bilobum TaxID=150636 RepID=UPI002AAF4161|nr:putative zinc finger protein CONSTANS-LIKE 11 [Gastrolobium bilobum]
MSSDLYTFDIPIHRHSRPDTVSYDGSGDHMFFSDPYHSPFFNVSPIDVARDNLNNSHDPFSPFSPQITHLENQSLYQTNPVQPLSNGTNMKNEFSNFPALDGSEVKREECQMGVGYTYNQHFLPHSLSGSESASKLLQRSFSCSSFHGNPGFPHSDTLMGSPKFQWHALSSPENNFFNGEMRKVCSTGDLQNFNTSRTQSPSSEKANFKVGRYSAEERKEKISKYRAKRSHRKFNKIIKYACRKTLADNRIRVRGRFARNDEISHILEAPCSIREELEDEFWIELIDELNGELLM